MKRAVLAFAIFLICAVVLRADEFHLKDGTTIVGTIVGYEGNSFRVKTAYGFALVDRNAIVSITVAKIAKAADTKSKRTAPENSKRATPPSARISKNRTPVTTKHEVSANPARDATLEKTKKPSPEKLPKPAAPPIAQTPKQTPATAAPTVVSASSPALATVPVREEVQGNLYINETYGFRIYKPPDWNVIEGARAALPGAVVAMGTSDQTTYLIIGFERASGTLQAHVASTNARLSNLFEDFRPSGLAQTIVAGSPAYEYRFHGSANGQEWSGTVALFARGENDFTIFGVTADTSDLVQIQQNIISRTISSLQFTSP